MLLVDASALVAIMRSEPEASRLEAMLGPDEARLTTAVALWEASRAIARLASTSQIAALEEVERNCTSLKITVIPIGEAEAREAVRAQQLFGKGTGHPARLNMGDCFAYACARTNGARLLYKGDDFVHTDLG